MGAEAAEDAPQRLDAACQRFDEDGLGHVQLRHRKTVVARIDCRDADEFRHASRIEMAASPDSAMDEAPAAAILALAARRMMVNEDQIADLNMRNGGSHLLCPADDLVTEHSADLFREVPGHQI